MADLVKISVLAEQSGVPLATIKHYLREGLLPPPQKRTGRNMAYYDIRIVERIRTIKQLQKEHFLPLKVIREVIDGQTKNVHEATAAAITRVLEQGAPSDRKSKQALLELGVAEDDLALLERLGLVRPGPDYGGADLALLRTLGAARKAGLTAEMLPIDILGPYAEAVRALVQVELELFQRGVLPRAGEALEPLTEAATALSEQLLIHVRRRLLLPELRRLLEAPAKAPRRGPRRTR